MPSRGTYSPGVLVDVGNASMLFVTGQLAIDPDAEFAALIAFITAGHAPEPVAK